MGRDVSGEVASKKLDHGKKREDRILDYAASS